MPVYGTVIDLISTILFLNLNDYVKHAWHKHGSNLFFLSDKNAKKTSISASKSTQQDLILNQQMFNSMEVIQTSTVVQTDQIIILTFSQAEQIIVLQLF